MRTADKGLPLYKQQPTVLKGNSSKGQQASKQVQLDTTPADRSTAKQQQALSDMAGGNKQRLGKLTGFYKRAANKQVVSAGDGSLATQSLQETAPGNLTPAVMHSSSVAAAGGSSPNHSHHHSCGQACSSGEVCCCCCCRRSLAFLMRNLQPVLKGCRSWGKA